MSPPNYQPSPDQPPLTAKQQKIFEFIGRYIQDNGYPPAIRDIGKAFGIVSPNGVMCHLKALQSKGYIHRDEKGDRDEDGKERGGRARSITIPGISAGGFSLPMLGLVAAGPVLEATEQAERVDFRDLFDGDNVYMLKVRGQSMIDSQIADGDYVVIRRQESADNGETVVAMVDAAMTLKRFYQKGERVRLEPCNDSMEPIIVDARKQNVTVLGVLVGVVRRLGK